MTGIGRSIVRLQELIATPMKPAPVWARKWQTEAEHVLHLSHDAKEIGDLNKLRKLDIEAERLNRKRSLT